jgi:hypothetical protein
VAAGEPTEPGAHPLGDPRHERALTHLHRAIQHASACAAMLRPLGRGQARPRAEAEAAIEEIRAAAAALGRADLGG